MVTTVLFGGDDQFVGGDTDDNISGMAGNDTLNGWNGNDMLFGGEGNDRLGDGSGKDQYYGGAGNDIIIAGFGDFGDIVEGGSGVDLLDLDYSLDTLGGLSVVFGANFQVLVGGSTAITVANVEALSLNASPLDDSISCGDGNDYINLNTGNDVLTAGGGDDTVQAWDHFTLNGGRGNDLLVLNLSAETVGVVIDVTAPKIKLNGAHLVGTATGFDQLSITGTTGNDVLTGGDLVDRFYGGAGLDTMFGGGGDDIIGLSAGGVAYGDAGNDVINGGSLAYGGRGDDRVQGSAANDAFYGGTGNDQLFGNGGSDTLMGGDGNDNLQNLATGSAYAGSGDDYVNIVLDSLAEVLDGGAGNDALSVGVINGGRLGIASGVHNRLDLSLNGVVIETATGFERISVVGGSLGDRIAGLDGNDTMLGAFGNMGAGDADVLSGNGGNDVLISYDGADTLLGGQGTDWLQGGWGADRLTGGSEADTFVFAQTADSTVAAHDLITDFKRGVDVIDLHQIDATPLDGLTDAFRFLGRVGFDLAAGGLIYHFDHGKTVVLADLGTDGVADFEIVLQGKIALHAGDFAL